MANPVAVVRAQPQRATTARAQVIDIRQTQQKQEVKVVQPRERKPDE